jgi:putative peptide modification system cyclase
MNALAQHVGPIAHSVAVPLLRTLLLCDLVDSTALVQRLGDQRAAELFRKHDRITRALLSTHGGREIDKTDGFLLMFDRPVQAVAFAIDYVRSLRDLNVAEGSTLSARVGIHVGDLVAWDNSADDIAKGAKPIEVEGLVKPITSRLMQLALPNQILLSGVAYEIAHRAQGELGARLENLRWRTHGRYRFKGVPDPITVFEAGEQGFAPLKAPPWSGKAHRETPFWRRPATLGIEMFLVMLAIAVPAWYLLRPAPAIAFAQRDWVVVGDLKNLTGDARFDESIETAFRMGLEQSRYVNVLSNLKARETVKLMQRDPEKTLIDRAVGAEVALRDGARAVILPTIAEIGGRVRVTAEVIDPNTQTTVYSESADGSGAESVLPSLDSVNQKLRLRLGEALATVSKESQPLEKAATKNLDALRAFSLAKRTASLGSLTEALKFYERAVDIDPDFALAHMEMGRVYDGMNDTRQASKQFAIASAAKGRLAPRDSLYADALQATYGTPDAALGYWKQLTSLYPDFFPAQGSYALSLWQRANDYPDAIHALEIAASPKNPHAVTSKYLLGILYLGTEKYDDALQQFAQTKGFAVPQFHAAVYAAQRDYTKATELIGRGTADDNGIGRLAFESAFALDRGQWKKGLTLFTDPSARKLTQLPRDVRRLESMTLGVRALADESAPMASTTALVDSLRTAALDKNNQMDIEDIGFHLMFAGYLGARAGDVKVARSALAAAEAFGREQGYAVLNNMRAIVQAEIAIDENQPARAVEQLKPLLDGRELYMTHVVLMDAYAADKNNAAAAAEATWLSSHRGRAYTEYGSEWVAMPFNVMQSNLAVLRSAEFALAAGRTQDARAQLTTFLKNSPSAEFPGKLAERIRQVEDATHPAGA